MSRNNRSGYVLSEDHQKIIDEFHQADEPPYMIGALSKKFQVKEIITKEMPFNISGSISKDENGRYVINLNKGESYNRRRFTAAHELAHLLLHKESIGDGIKDSALYRSKLSSWQEVQANKLAADILMPYKKIQELLDRGTKLNQLPAIFRVSNTAICIRLGIISGELALLLP